MNLNSYIKQLWLASNGQRQYTHETTAMRAGILQNARMFKKPCHHGHDGDRSQGNGVCEKEHIQEVDTQDSTVERSKAALNRR